LLLIIFFFILNTLIIIEKINLHFTGAKVPTNDDDEEYISAIIKDVNTKGTCKI